MIVQPDPSPSNFFEALGASAETLGASAQTRGLPKIYNAEGNNFTANSTPGQTALKVHEVLRKTFDEIPHTSTEKNLSQAADSLEKYKGRLVEKKDANTLSSWTRFFQKVFSLSYWFDADNWWLDSKITQTDRALSTIEQKRTKILAQKALETMGPLEIESQTSLTAESIPIGTTLQTLKQSVIEKSDTLLRKGQFEKVNNFLEQHDDVDLQNNVLRKLEKYLKKSWQAMQTPEKTPEQDLSTLLRDQYESTLLQAYRKRMRDNDNVSGRDEKQVAIFYSFLSQVDATTVETFKDDMSALSNSLQTKAKEDLGIALSILEHLPAKSSLTTNITSIIEEKLQNITIEVQEDRSDQQEENWANLITVYPKNFMKAHTDLKEQVKGLIKKIKVEPTLIEIYAKHIELNDDFLTRYFKDYMPKT
tara:strand:+ start:237 stop:1496 length:1260 start_codon:yes stop_codon:yes gene_type:complete